MIAVISPILGNVFSAVGLILLNKKIITVNGFNYMLLLTGFHFYFSSILCSLLLLMGFFQYKPINNYVALIKICMASLASIVFMNLNLTTNSIGFYQISKLSCIPITLLLETLLNTRQQSLNIMLTTSLLLIVLGMSMILINDISLNKIGLFWAACAVLSTSAGQVLFGPLQKQLGINSIQLLFHTSPILTIASYALIPVFDDVSSLLRTDVTSDLVINIILSCILASLLNMSNYFILSVTSPLTYQIIGHCKTILIIIGGIVLFDEYPSTKVLIGNCVVIVGVILYTEENRKQQLHKLSSLVKHLKQVSNEERHKKHNYFPLFITIPHHLMLSKSIDNCDSNDNDDDTKSMTTVSSASSLFHRSTDTFDSMESGEDQV